MICGFIHLQLRSDKKFTRIVSRMLGQYINFHAKKVADNQSMTQVTIKALCGEIWQQIEYFVGLSYSQVIMILLRTNPKEKTNSPILFPLFEATHTLIQRREPQAYPKVLVIILTVLFYYHWLQMFGPPYYTLPRKKHEKVKREKNLMRAQFLGIFEASLRSEQFEKFPDDAKLPKYSYLQAIDDKIRLFILLNERRVL